MKVPRGYLFNGINCGIKKKNKDLGIVISENPATVVGAFTTNEYKSHSLLICKQHIKKGLARALIVNSGNANCAIGKKGYQAGINICSRLAKVLNIKKQEVLIASTGIIGFPLSEKKIITNLKKILFTAKENKVMDFARAIMTTDTYPKVAVRELGYGGVILGVAKGAGMIAPDMATTLCFLFTDLGINRKILSSILKQAVKLTFNRITVDEEQSTNDTLLCFANYACGVKVDGEKKVREFTKAITEVLQDLAYMIVSDGEGATKIVKITVKRAGNVKVAEKIARRVAGSMLFKASIYGNSPNWGRIISCIGSLKLGIGNDFDVYYGRDKVISNGVSIYQKREKVRKYLKDNYEVEITIDLKRGKADYFLYTTDLSPDYVRLNS
jgi:glutamate N-acetyltransferase/amino-acid N-acetyltransferase